MPDKVQDFNAPHPGPAPSNLYRIFDMDVVTESYVHAYVGMDIKIGVMIMETTDANLGNDCCYCVAVC